MDHSESALQSIASIAPEDWANTPRAVQELVAELRRLFRLCRAQLEAQEERLEAQQAQLRLQQEPLESFAHENRQLKEEVQRLKDEIARLKNHTPRPKLKPSALENPPPKEDGPAGAEGKRPGSAKRSKTRELPIHETKRVKPEGLPEGSRLKGVEDWVVQDLRIEPHNTRYQLERWVTPNGESRVGELPEELGGGHFGPTLVSFILYQYYHARVTQPLILEQLREFQIDISSGQVNNIIIHGHERFHAEKDEILRVGLAVSTHIHVDDTGARHQGRNGYCTHIGNELFAWFGSTESKSRINFLQLLRAGRTDYVLNEDALAYLSALHLPKASFRKLALQEGRSFKDEEAWEGNLKRLGIVDQRHVRISTEGALLGSLFEHGFNRDLAIMSDDAGQFNVLLHILCWIHTERTLHKLVPFGDQQSQDLEQIRTRLWQLYADLKAYKQAPTPDRKTALEDRFDKLFTTTTSFTLLNHALKRIHQNRPELLLVLERPELPLHNNLSEGDIREYVTRRKISGSTRHPVGRRCRDTFTSLKKTCRKLGVSFWEYLLDRIRHTCHIPALAESIRRAAQALNPRATQGCEPQPR